MEERSVEEMIAAVCDEPTERPEPAAEPAEVEESTEESGAEPEEQEEAAEVEDEDSHESVEEKPRAKPVEKRISELTRKRYEAERQAEYWRQQAEERAKAQIQTPAENEPQLEDYADYDAYVRDLARFQAKQIVIEETQQQQVRQRQQAEEAAKAQRMETARKAIAKAAEQHEDFYEAMALAASVPIPEIVTDAIMDSAVVADIVYHLGKNPEELERIAALSPLAQIKEIGKLEDKITSRQALKQKQVKQPTRVETAGQGHPKKGPDLEQLWKQGQKTGDLTEYFKARGIISG